MRIIGCDLHARQQTISMLDTESGEVIEKTLAHEGETVREFYAALPKPVLVGLEATGSMFWFLRLLEELGIQYRVGHPAAIRKAETRKQKHDRRDAALIRRLLVEKRFPQIWLPTAEQRDLRTLLQHRHQLVRMRVMTQNGLQGLALSQGLRRGAKLWSQAGQQALDSLPLADYSRTVAPATEPAPAAVGSSGARAGRAAKRGAAVVEPPGRGTDHGAGHGSILGRRPAISQRQSGGQLRGNDSQRTLQRRQTAERKYKQAGQSAAAAIVGGSGASGGTQGCAVETVLSSQVGAERSGQGGGGHGAKAGHSAVDHDARPDRLHRVLPAGRTTVSPCGNA